MPYCQNVIAKIKDDESYIIILIQIVIVSLGFTQQKENISNDDLAHFKGEEIEELRKFIAKNIKYPKTAKLNCISGKVYVSFIVDSLGNVNSVEVVNKLGHGCDEEAIRVIKSTNGLWKPGTKNNKPINVGFTVPVTFWADKNCRPYYYEYLETGDKLFEKHKYHKAIVQYNNIIEIRPRNPDALFKRGLSKLYFNDTIGACYDWNNIPKVLNDKAKEYLLEYCE